MFKKARMETLRQRSRHLKISNEKTNKPPKGNMGHKPKHVAKHIPEHTLAAEFAGKILLI